MYVFLAEEEEEEEEQKQHVCNTAQKKYEKWRKKFTNYKETNTSTAEIQLKESK